MMVQGCGSGKTALFDHSAVKVDAQVMMMPVWPGRTGINTDQLLYAKTILLIGSNELVQDTAHETRQMLWVILYNKTHVSKATIDV